MQDRQGAPGGGGVRRDGPPEKIAVRAAAPAVSIELREDWTGRWYIFRARSDDLEQVEGVSTPTAPLMYALGRSKADISDVHRDVRYAPQTWIEAPGMPALCKERTNAL